MTVEEYKILIACSLTWVPVSHTLDSYQRLYRTEDSRESWTNYISFYIHSPFLCIPLSVISDCLGKRKRRGEAGKKQVPEREITSVWCFM